MVLKHSVYDTDTHFSVDPTSRMLNNEACQKSCLIQGDHNSERFTFELPRIIEGHDMSLCDIVQIHYINIDAQTKAQSKGVYEVEDMQVSPNGDDVVICSWLISGNATMYVGGLSFLIRFSCAREDGHVYYVWNSAIYSGISVSDGINNGDVVVEEYADILTQWQRELEANQIVSLEQTQVGAGDGGTNIWTMTFGDGRTSELAVKNGSKGDKGDPSDVSHTEVEAMIAPVREVAENAQRAAENANANANSRAKTVTHTASVTTTWSGSASAGYTQTISVADILATDNPIVDCVFGTDISANKLYSTAWGLITRITTADGSITLYANTDKPATAFTVQLKVVR